MKRLKKIKKKDKKHCCQFLTVVVSFIECNGFSAAFNRQTMRRRIYNYGKGDKCLSR